MNQFITYAQNREDAILNAYFKDVEKGTYVDIGANHPTEDSVTKHFYDKGWRGVNVEPIKEMFNLLVRERPEDINVRVGVSDKKGKLKLREYTNSGLSTFSNDMKNLYEKDPDDKTVTYKDVTVPVVLFKDLLSKYNIGHIHFMKIDVEGYEYEVLQGNDWSKYRPEMICIESNHQVKDWRPILTRNGYSKVWNDGLNDYYLAKESLRRKDNFSYADDILMSRQVIPYHVVDHIVSLLNSVNSEKLNAQAYKMRVDRLINENNTLIELLFKERRLRYAIINLVKGVDKAILAQIERLHKPPRRILTAHRHSLTYEVTSAQELLKIVQEADLRAYYTQIRNQRDNRLIIYAYKTSLSIYITIRRFLGLFYKVALLITKKRVNQ